MRMTLTMAFLSVTTLFKQYPKQWVTTQIVDLCGLFGETSSTGWFIDWWDIIWIVDQLILIEFELLHLILDTLKIFEDFSAPVMYINLFCWYVVVRQIYLSVISFQCPLVFTLNWMIWLNLIKPGSWSVSIVWRWL